jgi:hypothetical protein
LGPYEEDIKLPPTKDGYEWIMMRFPSGDWHMEYTQEGRTKGKLVIEEDRDDTVKAVREDERKSKRKGRKKRMEIVDEGAERLAALFEKVRLGEDAYQGKHPQRQSWEGLEREGFHHPQYGPQPRYYRQHHRDDDYAFFRDRHDHEQSQRHSMRGEPWPTDAADQYPAPSFPTQPRNPHGPALSMHPHCHRYTHDGKVWYKDRIEDESLFERLKSRFSSQR